jgi:hypothetical protein
MNHIKLFNLFLNENYALNKILDKISKSGKGSLSKYELEYLSKYSSDIIDNELERTIEFDYNDEIRGNINGNIIIFKSTDDYSDNDHMEDESNTYVGEVVYNDETYYGRIYCDLDDNFDVAIFTTEEEYDLYETYADFRDELNDFFSNKVCTYLRNLD